MQRLCNTTRGALPQYRNNHLAARKDTIITITKITVTIPPLLKNIVIILSLLLSFTDVYCYQHWYHQCHQYHQYKKLTTQPFLHSLRGTLPAQAFVVLLVLVLVAVAVVAAAVVAAVVVVVDNFVAVAEVAAERPVGNRVAAVLLPQES